MNPNDIAKLLPRVYQETFGSNQPLQALLAVMQGMHSPVETILSKLDSYFSPYKAPDWMIPYLATWVDLDRCFIKKGLSQQDFGDEPLSTGQGRLRELIAAASELSQWRGTTYGLTLFLQIVTGEKGFRIEEEVYDEQGEPLVFYFEVHAPPDTEKYRQLIEHIVEQEKPAYVSHKVIFD